MSAEDHCLELTERIWEGENCLAYIIRADFLPNKTTFLTPAHYKQQVGYVIYPARGEINRHVHCPLERNIVGTTEVLIVRKGRCEVDIYNEKRQLVATRELCEGDIILMLRGGHSFRILEDTVFIEIKQGPYVGPEEKEHF